MWGVRGVSAPDEGDQEDPGIVDGVPAWVVVSTWVVLALVGGLVIWVALVS